MAEPADGHPPPIAANALPIAAASAVLFNGDRVLLVERANGPAAGRWSLPGGHVEPGESAEAAARREVCEETGLVAGGLEMFGVHDVHVPADGAAPARHYRITVFLGLMPATAPVAGSDARAARFVDVGELSPLPLTDGALSLIGRAHAHARAMISRER